MRELDPDRLPPGARWQAPYASDPGMSRGRRFDEPESPTRTVFQRDRDRIVHSNAFRRLKHKTQVFVHHEGDHYRTRLTHSLEVAQIARSLARPLGLDEDLTEALALAHDLGHPPFGHAGERALNLALADFGGFDHNAQTLRVVTRLERRYPDFDGLNLTWETLEGLVKHNGPLIVLTTEPGQGETAALPYAIKAYQDIHDLELDRHSSLESQIAALSDDVAYNSHDVEDGLRAGLITLNDLEGVELTGSILKRIRQDYPGLDDTRTTYELIRRCITVMIEDIIVQTRRNLMRSGARSVDDIRGAGLTHAAFSPAMIAQERALKAFLFEQIYRSDVVMGPVRSAEAVVAELFAAYFKEPGLLPVDWRGKPRKGDETQRARRIADYIAGMTDRFALAEYARLFDEMPELG